MDKWADDVMIKLQELTKADRDYQELLQECYCTEKRYSEIMGRLSETEREEVERYIVICVDMQYRLAQLAYHYGVGEGRADIYKLISRATPG